MHILTPENRPFDMTAVPDQVEDDLRYCVLNYANGAGDDTDFYFIPLVFLDIFSRPAADLKIGPYRVQLPLDWSIIIADKNLGMMEVIELKHLNDREFDAFVFNPLKSYMPEFCEISIVNIFHDVTWYVPRLKLGHLMAVPLTDGPNPPCIYITKETNRIPESLDITKIFS